MKRMMMKKVILTMIIIYNSALFGSSDKLNIIVSILPQKEFVYAITKEKANINIMVSQGQNAHTYEPKPSQMVAISKANIYFAIGLEFEESWLDKFTSSNKELKIVTHKEQNNNKRYDPHIWTDPFKVKEIVKKIYQEIILLDPKNITFYKKNLNNYLKYIDGINNQIKLNLTCKTLNNKFLVFHPAWGYFANRYHLEQLSIEIDGKSPKPKLLAQILEKSKKNNLKKIFIQPSFSPRFANLLAKRLKLQVVKISPSAKDWGDNLIYFSKSLCD